MREKMIILELLAIHTGPKLSPSLAINRENQYTQYSRLAKLSIYILDTYIIKIDKFIEQVPQAFIQFANFHIIRVLL